MNNEHMNIYNSKNRSQKPEHELHILTDLTTDAGILSAYLVECVRIKGEYSFGDTAVAYTKIHACKKDDADYHRL